MLITETTKTIVQCASLGVGIVGAVAALVNVRRRSRTLPTAVVNEQRSLARVGLRLSPLVCLPLGIAGLYWASSHKIEVLVVRDGHSVHGDRVLERRLGSKPLEFAVASGNKQVEALIGKPCWTVNKSSKPIRLVSVDYVPNGKHFVETESVTVLPGQRASDCWFNYYGPEFAPPDTLKESVRQVEFATWLTWAEQK